MFCLLANPFVPSHLINISPLPFHYFICLPLPPSSRSLGNKARWGWMSVTLSSPCSVFIPSRMLKSTFVAYLLFSTPSISLTSPRLILSFLSSQLSASDSISLLLLLPPVLHLFRRYKPFYLFPYRFLDPASLFISPSVLFILPLLLFHIVVSGTSHPLAWFLFSPLSFFLSAP